MSLIKCINYDLRERLRLPLMSQDFQCGGRCFNKQKNIIDVKVSEIQVYNNKICVDTYWQLIFAQ